MQRKKRIAGAIAGIGFCILLGSGIALWEHFQGDAKEQQKKTPVSDEPYKDQTISPKASLSAAGCHIKKCAGDQCKQKETSGNGCADTCQQCNCPQMVFAASIDPAYRFLFHFPLNPFHPLHTRSVSLMIHFLARIELHQIFT